MTEMLLDRVQQNLQRFRFSRAPEILPDLLVRAEQESLSPLTVIDQLLEDEVAFKEDHRIASVLKLASLPFVRTIDDYDFAFHHEIDRPWIMNLSDLTFLTRKENVLLLGPPGVGKPHLAVALVVKAAHAGTSIYFTTMADLVAKLKTYESSGRNTNTRYYYKAGLVVVDEVGYIPIDRKECYLFFRSVSRRYENADLVITSNKGFTEWTELFEDSVLVTALLDRLLHHSVIITIKGQSYRLKGSSHRRANPAPRTDPHAPNDADERRSPKNKRTECPRTGDLPPGLGVWSKMSSKEGDLGIIGGTLFRVARHFFEKPQISEVF